MAVSSVTLTGSATADELQGRSGDDLISGLAGNDKLFGNEGNDVLDGGAGNDYLDGGLGADQMSGGTGDDTYLVDSSSDVVLELANEGTDWVISTVALNLAANVENLDLRTSTYAVARGNNLANILYGSAAGSDLYGGDGNDSIYGRSNGTDRLWGDAGDDYLDGGLGNDEMRGGTGNDTYVVRDSGDLILEGVGEGIDWVKSVVSYTLSDNVENIYLVDTTDINATGNSLDNSLFGGAGHNRLEGGGGNDYLNGGASSDVMLGGIGNDTYVVDDSADKVIEAAAEGVDWVIATVDQTLGANVENLDMRGTGSLVGIGNELGNIMYGSASGTKLDGGDGNDSLYGRSADTDTLLGGAGNDYLDGGAGGDIMNGGTGNDTYRVDSASDKVSESANEGVDWVLASVDYTLGEELEGLQLQGIDNLKAIGNELNNSIYGNSGNNIIDAGAGNDLLFGGAGVDKLTGGKGMDEFLLGSREANGSLLADQVMDFTTGEDRLMIFRTGAFAADSQLAQQLKAGVLGASNFQVVTDDHPEKSTAAFVFDNHSGILYANDTSKGTLEALAQIAPDATGHIPLLDAKSIELV
jgi:Ca2+-binding RTX toxin-like protein